jgi:hypothetical protein
MSQATMGMDSNYAFRTFQRAYPYQNQNRQGMGLAGGYDSGATTLRQRAMQSSPGPVEQPQAMTNRQNFLRSVAINNGLDAAGKGNGLKADLMLAPFYGQNYTQNRGIQAQEAAAQNNYIGSQTAVNNANAAGISAQADRYQQMTPGEVQGQGIGNRLKAGLVPAQLSQANAHASQAQTAASMAPKQAMAQMQAQEALLGQHKELQSKYDALVRERDALAARIASQGTQQQRLDQGAQRIQQGQQRIQQGQQRIQQGQQRVNQAQQRLDSGSAATQPAATQPSAPVSSPVSVAQPVVDPNAPPGATHRRFNPLTGQYEYRSIPGGNA